MKKLVYITFLITSTLIGQENLSLDACYNLLLENYPLAKQTEILARQNELDLEVIKTKKMPKLDLLVQATYQSDVTKTPFMGPETGIEAPNLDQYKSNLSLNQLIYGGGEVNAVSSVKAASLKTKQQQIEVNLHQLKRQVNQLYFSILHLQEKRLLLNAKQNQLSVKLNEVKSGIKHGVILPSSDKIIEVELLKINQQIIELDFNKKSLFNTLSKLLATEISATTNIENPTVTTNLFADISRPELSLFQFKKDEIEQSQLLISKRNIPKIVGFATGGIGNPGLNMLENAFKSYYWVGLRLNWSVYDWHAAKKERQSLLINKEIVENEAEIFQLNTQIELDQQASEISKINEFIASDETIIELRKSILSTTESQLNNGVITSSDYITELTHLFEAENNLNTHKIQLLLTKANYNITQGN